MSAHREILLSVDKKGSGGHHGPDEDPQPGLVTLQVVAHQT